MEAAVQTEPVAVSRSAAIGAGIAMAVAGLVVFFWPGITTLVLVSWFGISIALYGATELGIAIGGSEDRSRLWAGIVGVISLLGGVSVFLTPILSTITVGTVIGVYWIVGGVAGLLGAVLQSGHRIVRGIVAVISLIAGASVLAQPGLSLVALTWFSGMWMVVSGLVLAGTALVRGRIA